MEAEGCIPDKQEYRTEISVLKAKVKVKGGEGQGWFILGKGKSTGYKLRGEGPVGTQPFAG